MHVSYLILFNLVLTAFSCFDDPDGIFAYLHHVLPTLTSRLRLPHSSRPMPLRGYTCLDLPYLYLTLPYLTLTAYN